MTRSDQWPFIVPYIKPGAPITLINWYRDGDEWRHQLIRGRYQRRTPTAWILITDGHEHHYDLERWALARE